MSQGKPVETGVSTSGEPAPSETAPADEPLLTDASMRERESSGIGEAPTLRTLTPTRLERLRPSHLLPVVDPAHYALVGELAHGGIGRILRARDLRLGRPVAIKQMLSPTPGAESRFMTEAFVTARLQHPAIVPVYEAGRWPNGELFYSMKLVSGRSLADVLAEPTTLEGRLALLPHVLAVAEAMAYSHSERIIHRDLKPANILVGGFGETVVIDWGLAKDLSRAGNTTLSQALVPEGSSPDDGLTRVGTVMGTPAYMPPEQAAGQAVDERADVYALGAILYHLLAGTRPYEGNTSDQVLAKVVSGPPGPLPPPGGHPEGSAGHREQGDGAPSRRALRHGTRDGGGSAALPDGTDRRSVRVLADGVAAPFREASPGRGGGHGGGPVAARHPGRGEHPPDFHRAGCRPGGPTERAVPRR
ncbi:serine/threonine-protein kinase [Cystobacter fuscus]